MNKLLCVLAFAVVASCMVQSAHGAGPLTNPTDWDSVVMPDKTDVTLYLDKYDGQCVQPLDLIVEVWFEVRFTGARVEMDNDNPFSATGTGKVANVVTSFASPDVGLVMDLGPPLDVVDASDFGNVWSQTFNLGPSTGDPCGFDVTGDVDYADYNPGPLSMGDGGVIAPVYESDYVGTGQFAVTINCEYLTGATFSGPWGFFNGSTPAGEFYGEVKYTCIPEPFSVACLGLGAVSMLRRKRRS